MFEQPSLLGWRQTSEQNPDADEINEDLLGASESFMVFTQAPLPAQPGKGAFDDPVSGDDPETRLSAQIGEEFWCVALQLPKLGIDDLHPPTMFLLCPALEA